MAIHWQIHFRSLRVNTQYAVNILDNAYSGDPIPLKGAAQPFTTQEADNEDGFIPIRTQTGYIRIVDDGKDANGNAFNWKDLLPTTDTDRPVTLTQKVNNSWVVIWQGFMQAQNFSGTLYGNPQEMDFPVQCALTILEGTDINYQQTSIQNFAYLLNHIISAIPTINITTIKIQGNTDAQQWLLKKLDWQNFITSDEDDNLSARYNLFQCLEDMCRFWGWTARTFGTTLYLTCADDPDEQLWLTLDRSQLNTMAGGTAAGSTGGTFPVITLSGDIFASTKQDDFRQRGPNKASVEANCNEADQTMFDMEDGTLVKKLEEQGWGSPETLPNEKYVTYTNDLTSFSNNTFVGSTRSGYGSFNIIRIQESLRDPNGNEMPVIRIKKTYDGGDAFASFESVYEHCFSNGYIALHGSIYRQAEQFKAYDEENTTRPGHEVGDKTMYVRIGIGSDRNHALWFNGRTWSSTRTDITVRIGNADDLFRLSVQGSGGSSFMNNSIHVASAITGKLFLDFLGSSDIDDIDGQKSFDITDFYLAFSFENGRVVSLPSSITRSNRQSVRKYLSTNGNKVRDEFINNIIYASNNNMNYGYGLLINPDGTFMTTLSYNGSSVLEYPEQHLADRVTAYWATAKRRIATELRSNADNVGSITPQTRVSIDGTTMFPIAFGHEWRDDITQLTLLEL